MGDAPPPEDPRIAAVATLARALLNVTLIQVLGYMMATHKLLPEAALPGAGAFIGLISLPAIYFRAVATLDFGTVRVQVLVALLLGKLLLVALSSKLGAMTQRKGEGPGAAEMRGGVFALLTTNSDDLGLGLPVMGALFKPELVQMCYVLNAMQAMVFNPQIFMLFGIGSAKRDAAASGKPPPPTKALVLSVLRGQTKNFLNIAVVSGLLWNLLLGGGRGCPLPFFLESLFVTMGGAFGPIVLFLGGARNVGAFAQLSALTSILMPLLTVLLKVLVLPTFVANVAGWLGGTRATVDFAFAFSTLPSAASTLVFAAPYKPSDDMASLMNASLLLHKVVGFPVLFLAAAIATTTDAHEIVEIERVVALDTQALCAIPALLLVVSRLWYDGWAPPPLSHLYAVAAWTLAFLVASILGTWLLDATLSSPTPADDAFAFAFTSFARWAADATLVAAAYLSAADARARLAAARQRASTRNLLAQQTRASALAEPLMGGGGGGARRFSKLSEPTRPLVAWGIVGAAAAAGLVMTLPWAVTLTYPTADHLDHMLPLWVPYLGSTQPLVYAIVYACGAIALLVCAGLMISADAEANELIGGKKHEKLLKLRKTHQFLVRFQCLLFLSATRMALAAAICAGLCVGDIDAADLTGSIAIMLLIQSLLANSTGLVLFVLFGTSDGVFAAPAAWLKAAAGRAEVVALLKVDSEIKDDVVDEIEQAAAGAGYEEPFPTTRMLKKAGAATRIAAKWKLEFRRRSIARSSA